MLLPCSTLINNVAVGIDYGPQKHVTCDVLLSCFFGIRWCHVMDLQAFGNS